MLSHRVHSPSSIIHSQLSSTVRPYRTNENSTGPRQATTHDSGRSAYPAHLRHRNQSPSRTSGRYSPRKDSRGSLRRSTDTARSAFPASSQDRPARPPRIRHPAGSTGQVLPRPPAPARRRKTPPAERHTRPYSISINTGQ